MAPPDQSNLSQAAPPQKQDSALPKALTIYREAALGFTSKESPQVVLRLTAYTVISGKTTGRVCGSVATRSIRLPYVRMLILNLTH